MARALAASAEIERLIQLLARLPGLGPRSARRAALQLVKKKEQLWARSPRRSPRRAIRIVTCEICGNIDTVSPCTLCRDETRDRSLICVVEEVGDLWALERAHVLNGLYHVLGGTLSPLDGIGPEDFSIAKLIERARDPQVKEVLLALNATVEGQSTAHYLMDQLARLQRHRLAPRPWRADRRRARLSRRGHARRRRQGPQGDVMANPQSIGRTKTRELHNHHFDSTIWNDFKFRDDDIVIATYAKSGTTWMQQIVGQLLFNGAEDLAVAEMSPWLDLRVPPKEVKLPAVEAQTHRRFLKTHLPVDALVFSPRAKYIYIGRDGRDVVWSMYNHHANANERLVPAR